MPENSRSEVINKHVYTDNWFDFAHLYEAVAKNEDYKVFVELGVWKGHSIAYLADKLRGRDCEVYAIDLFENTYRWADEKEKANLLEQVPYIYDIYNKYLQITGTRDLITDIKGVSWECAEQFEDDSVDFIFIDADHSYDAVNKDIRAWSPKVRKGGMISGHDYFNSNGVKRAVDEIFPQAVIHNNSGSWSLVT